MTRKIGAVMALCAAMTEGAPAFAETSTSPRAYAPSPYAPLPSYAPVYDPHELPPPEPIVRRPRVRASLPMMITGIGLTATGGALELAALVAAASGFMQSGSHQSGRDIAGGLAVGGLASLTIGIPLLVVGAQKVPQRSALLGVPTANGWMWRF